MNCRRLAGPGLAALLLGALLAGGADPAAASMPAPEPALRGAVTLTPVQFYGPYGYRPHGYYRPRAFYGRNPYAVAKQRNRTRLNYCNNQPSRC